MTRKNPAAVELGRKGGKARVAKMSKEELSSANRKAAEARWAKMDRNLDKLEVITEQIAEKSKALEQIGRKKARMKRHDLGRSR